METILPVPSVEKWPADVQEFAQCHGVEGYLGPLLKRTWEMFPTATSVRLMLEHDPELRDVSFILLELRVPPRDVPSYRDATSLWTREFLRMCPGPARNFFSFFLSLGES